MMPFPIRLLCIVLAFLLLTGCGGRRETAPFDVNNTELLHRNEDQLTRVIIYDIFTPPVAARIYVYSALAAYEAIRFSKPGAPSVIDRARGFAPCPEPERAKEYNYLLAATRAFFTVTRNVRVFAVDSLKRYEDSVYTGFHENLSDSVYERSVVFGDRVAAVILGRAKKDGYVLSRGKPRHLGSNDPGKWRPTPPDYLDGVEWCWNTMNTLVLDSASQFRIQPPAPYSTDTNSVFFRNVREVFTIAGNLTAEQQLIARYWDDNPFVIEHSGHLSFGNKKITPGGHWMGVASIAARTAGADAVKTALTFALTSVSLYEAFIACWDEKYRSNYVRPVTVINLEIDKLWTPYLQTPPFPEYPSGHSAITRAAAGVLTHLYGESFRFLDTSDLEYIGLQREFTSFIQAAEEASISRVYGGIHFLPSVVAGTELGQRVGDLVVSTFIR